MEQPDERTRFDDSDSTQRDSSSERSPHSVDADEEKFLLLHGEKEATRNGSWRNRWSWSRSTRVQAAVTIFNISLFSISVIILSTTRGAKMLSEQDYWRATSYYCNSLLLTVVRNQATNEHHSPSFRPPHHPHIHTHHKRHILGHRPPLHLARPHRRRRRRSLGIRWQQHHAHRHNLRRRPRARQRPLNRRQSTSRTQLRR
jgi:hypothetical protein